MCSAFAGAGSCVTWTELLTATRVTNRTISSTQLITVSMTSTTVSHNSSSGQGNHEHTVWATRVISCRMWVTRSMTLSVTDLQLIVTTGASAVARRYPVSSQATARARGCAGLRFELDPAGLDQT